MENKENMKFDFVVMDETSDPPEVAIKVGFLCLCPHSYSPIHTCCVLDMCVFPFLV